MKIACFRSGLKYGTDNESREFLYKEIDKQIENVEPLYPQIFIPFYEELKGAGKLGSEQPIIVLRDGTPTTDGKYQGYSFENGELLSKGMISEEYASEHEVWVIGVNERVDEKGEVANRNENNKLASVHYALVKFQGLTIHGKSNMKEDWIGGAAGVSLTIRKIYDGTYNPETWGVYSANDNREIYQDEITNVSRRDARKSNYQNLSGSNIYFYNVWQIIGNPTNPTTIVYSLFEYDLWPARKHDLYIDNLWMVYRSYESPWVSEKILLTQMGNYARSANGLSFSLTQ